jgi:two-component system chemotaxis sensor kinase CheA
MVVPITSILETIRPKSDSIHALGPDGPLLSIRGNFVPIVDVGRKLGFSQSSSSDQPSVLLLVESELSGQYALGVDSILDQRQVVIKSLDTVCGDIPGVSAATILGDGKIAMIIDPESVVKITSDADLPLPPKTLERSPQDACAK